MNIIVSQPIDASPLIIDVAAAAPVIGSARLHHRFLWQAARTPDAPAVLHAGQYTTYRALDERSNRIAHVLRGQGIVPGDRVGICLDRSSDLVAAVLAVLKAGAAYVPFDLTYPRDRLDYMLADCEPALLIGMPGGPAFGIPTLTLAANPALDSAPVTPVAESDDRNLPGLACVLFTSGSTGRPKGVMLGHTATRFIDWADRTLGRDALARVAATTSLCFDPSIFEIFAPLSLGGLVILKRDLLEPFSHAERPTLLNGVPSAFMGLVRENRIPGSVRVINVGGERLSASLARMIHQHAGASIQLWNHYGPTETTICASVALIPANIDADPTIGRPIAGAVFHVLDAAGHPVLPGASGELHIGGTGVALGYLHQPELTGERFLPDPFRPGARMYRTGDIVRVTGDGDLAFLGREGRQIKLHGFRIELDEIETALLCLAGIDAAAVLGPTGQDGLVDGIKAVIATSENWTLGRLRHALRDSLPRHMLPNRLIVLHALPLTPSGKVDRQALSLLGTQATARLAAEDPWMPPLTEAVLTVFRDVLHQPALGQHDDFFDQGGDSLQAMDVLVRLETLLGQAMPVGLLAKDANAATLAGLISRRLALLAPTRESARAIPLREHGPGAPLFCLADTHTQPLQALALAYRLGPDRQVWSLVPSRNGSAQDHFRSLCAQTSNQPLLLLAAGKTAPDATCLAISLASEQRSIVLVLVAPVFPPDTRTGMRKLFDWLRPHAPARGAIRRAGPQPFRGQTILVHAAGAPGIIPPGQLRYGKIDRIVLDATGSLLREPAVSKLADALRVCLPPLERAATYKPRADAYRCTAIPGQVGDAT